MSGKNEWKIVQENVKRKRTHGRKCVTDSFFQQQAVNFRLRWHSLIKAARGWLYREGFAPNSHSAAEYKHTNGCHITAEC